MSRLCICLSAIALLAAPMVSAQPATSPFHVERIADGVYAAIPTRPAGLLVASNHLFIVNDRDVVVVDADFSPTLSRAAIAEIRKITDKPVTAVINTHWHDDHFLGNAAYAEAFPGVDFIAQRAALTYLPTVGEDNRRKMLEGEKGFIDQLRADVEKNVNLGGKPLADSERSAYLADIAQWEPYERETPGLKTYPPTVVVDDVVTLTRGSRRIEVRHLGRGHTAGDVVVYLPQEKIVASGDLVFAPVPFVGSDQSYVADWITTLGALMDLGATTLIPGHGPVMHDMTFVNDERALLTSIKTQTEAAMARGVSQADAVKAVDVEAFRKSMTGDQPILNLQFRNFVVPPAVAAIYRERR